MLRDDTIKELKKAFDQAKDGFLVVDAGQPKFAVIGFETYERFRRAGPAQQPASGTAQKILVTGGAGYIGSHAVRLLQKLGYEIVVYDNLSTGRKEAVSGCRLVEADLADREALRRVFAEENFGSVMHFAASTSVEESMKDPAKYFQNNVLGGLNLIDAMLERGVSKLIFSSTCAVYGTPSEFPVAENNPRVPESPYGLSKMMFEDILRWYASAYKLNSISLRYFNAAGAWPDENLGYRVGDNTLLVPRVMEVAVGRVSEIDVYGQDYGTKDGTAIRDYIHVLDVADSHVFALQKLAELDGAHFYNVGSGEGSTVLEVIDAAVEVTSRMVPMKFCERRPGDPEKLYADTQKIRSELGWKSKHNLQEILASSWEWHKRLSGK